MAEHWKRTPEGKHLAGRVKAGTGPEIALRKALHAAGARFRVQCTLTRGCTPDVVLPSRRVAVFVDGCFWHGCPQHGRQTPWTGPNAELWEAKMRRNAERDARSTQLAQDLGWDVVRVWECQVRKDPTACVTAVLRPDPPGGSVPS